MNNLTFNLDKYKKPTNLSAHMWQDSAAKALEILHPPKNQISNIFKFFKKDSIKAEQSIRYIKERNDITTPHKYFIWLMTH